MTARPRQDLFVAYDTGFLAGRAAIVSGVGDGLGRQSALALVRHGAAVVLCARTADRLESIADEVRSVGGNVVSVAGDIGDANYCARVAETALGALGVSTVW